jgi:hypothetical protein
MGTLDLWFALKIKEKLGFSKETEFLLVLLVLAFYGVLITLHGGDGWLSVFT